MDGDLPDGVSMSATGAISGTPKVAEGPDDITVEVVDNGSVSMVADATLSLEIGANPVSDPSTSLYSFAIETSNGASGYDAAGNVTAYDDSVNGTWSFTYDSLNRLATGSGTQANNPYPNLCWQYDSFGNRLWETSSTTPYTAGQNGGTNSCPVTSGPSFWAQYNGTVNGSNNNQMSGTSLNVNQGNSYDPSGNIYYDGVNSYLYDGEGRICAVEKTAGGVTSMTQYIYDAEGQRVAKASISTFTCDTTSNGFNPTTVYVLGPGGEQMSELTNTSGTWHFWHTNVYAAGQLMATYDADPTGTTEGILYFQLSDWLSTRRQQTDYAGYPRLNFLSQPYGDSMSQVLDSSTSVADATEQHFTGKERDSESGNDYFGARYMASSMGRFLSPDPSPAGINVANPQSWNLYNYSLNNPLRFVDKNGYWATDVHAQIVTYSLQNYVSAGELNELRARQYSMDADQSNQNRHSMANTGQSSADALNGMWNFVRDEMNIVSQNVSSSGALNGAGLDALGDAMHTLEDYTSPMHTDSNFMPMEWKGGYWPPWKMGPGAVHVMGEGSPANDWSRIGLAVRLTMAAYLQSGAACEAGKSCLTEGNFESEVRKNIESYVNNFYNSQPISLSPGRNEIEEDAARQCALGNPAACDH